MGQPKPYLIAGGAISALISIFHLMLALNPTLYKFISPGQESILAHMTLAGSSLTTFASLALTLMFAFWATYAFSGAGSIGRLPVLRAALVAIGGIYILHALFLP